MIAACLECGVHKLVDCSSPSTRFKGGSYGGDVTGQTEQEMPYPASFSHEWVTAWSSSVLCLEVSSLALDFSSNCVPWSRYARTKALGEQAVLRANGEKGKNKAGVELLTCAVAPHQVYGPTDTLFLPAMLDTASR